MYITIKIHTLMLRAYHRAAAGGSCACVRARVRAASSRLEWGRAAIGCHRRQCSLTVLRQTLGAYQA